MFHTEFAPLLKVPPLIVSEASVCVIVTGFAFGPVPLKLAVALLTLRSAVEAIWLVPPTKVSEPLPLRITSPDKAVTPPVFARCSRPSLIVSVPLLVFAEEPPRVSCPAPFFSHAVVPARGALIVAFTCVVRMESSKVRASLPAIV
jgi:hypothetical protein